MEFIDEVVQIKTEEAKDRARELAKEGIFVGISAGANVLACERWLEDNKGKEAITILCDRGERYFSCL